MHCYKSSPCSEGSHAVALVKRRRKRNGSRKVVEGEEEEKGEVGIEKQDKEEESE